MLFLFAPILHFSLVRRCSFRRDNVQGVALNVQGSRSKFLLMKIFAVSAAYTGELGTGHFLQYKRKSGLTGDFYFKNGFWGFKNLHYKRKSGLSDYGLSGGHCMYVQRFSDLPESSLTEFRV